MRYFVPPSIPFLSFPFLSFPFFFFPFVSFRIGKVEGLTFHLSFPLRSPFSKNRSIPFLGEKEMIEVAVINSREGIILISTSRLVTHPR